jgi:hypothetical protein
MRQYSYGRNTVPIIRNQIAIRAHPALAGPGFPLVSFARQAGQKDTASIPCAKTKHPARGAGPAVDTAYAPSAGFVIAGLESAALFAVQVAADPHRVVPGPQGNAAPA